MNNKGFFLQLKYTQLRVTTISVNFTCMKLHIPYTHLTRSVHVLLFYADVIAAIPLSGTVDGGQSAYCRVDHNCLISSKWNNYF